MRVWECVLLAFLELIQILLVRYVEKDFHREVLPPSEQERMAIFLQYTLLCLLQYVIPNQVCDLYVIREFLQRGDQDQNIQVFTKMYHHCRFDLKIR